MLLTQLGSSNYLLIILYTAILYHVTGIYSSKSLYSSTLCELLEQQGTKRGLCPGGTLGKWECWAPQ